eukprot:TRINITY_DN43644_c0_g1_i1.p1 TRINITY_DN43644_c0_g1~~TRINITY_DN43644_c0_g1_i1.p1  ORF type:complete len:585 (-),score=73.17 TRINITY_DN43644_c0_g1_i1:21-1751(-)
MSRHGLVLFVFVLVAAGYFGRQLIPAPSIVKPPATPQPATAAPPPQRTSLAPVSIQAAPSIQNTTIAAPRPDSSEHPATLSANPPRSAPDIPLREKGVPSARVEEEKESELTRLLAFTPPVTRVENVTVPHWRMARDHPMLDLRMVDENLRAKALLVAQARPKLRYFRMCETQSTRSFANGWDGSSAIWVQVVDVVWEPSLPFLEFLVFIGPGRIRKRTCVTFFPHGRVTLRIGPTDVKCGNYFPARGIQSKEGIKWTGIDQPIAAGVRYLCPIPSGLARRIDAAGGFNGTLLSLHPKGSSSLPVSVCAVRKRSVTLTGCSEPLWGLPTLVRAFPRLLHEWLAYLRLVGFDKVQMYEKIDREFGKPLKRWIASGFVEYHPVWVKQQMAAKTRGETYCMQALSHEHCMFANQLTSQWVMITHGPDYFPYPNTTRYPAGMKGFLQKHALSSTGELRVYSQICRTDHKPATGSKPVRLPGLLGTGILCQEPAGYVRNLWFPVVNPRTAMSTFNHFAMAIHPAARPPVRMVMEADLIGKHVINAFVERDSDMGKRHYAAPQFVEMSAAVEDLAKRFIPDA